MIKVIRDMVHSFGRGSRGSVASSEKSDFYGRVIKKGRSLKTAAGAFLASSGAFRARKTALACIFHPISSMSGVISPT